MFLKKNKPSNLLLLICAIVLFSCQQENKADSDMGAVENEKVEVEKSEVESEELYENLITEDLGNEEGKDAGLIAEEKKHKEERKKIIDEQLKESKVAKEFKDDCEAIFEKYSKTVNKYISTQDESILDDIIHFINDPVFESCRKNEDYKDKFDAIDAKME